MRQAVIRISLVIFGVVAAISCGDNERSPNLLDTASVSQLLDVLDTIAAHAPAIGQISERLRTLDRVAQRKYLDSLTDRNRNEPSVSAAINALVTSPGYQFYYSHFKNITPEVHRSILCHLPHEVIDAPGGIGDVLHELYFHRNEVRLWLASVASGIDTDRARRIATEWLPPGEYSLPTTIFFYDGNGDAFAAKGGVGFDLYGVLLARLSNDRRFSELSTMNSDWIEKTLAHEYHHIFSGDMIYGASNESSPAAAGVAKITRQIVNEGMATQCDPRTGLDGEIINDTSIIRYWIADLKQHASVLAENSQSKPAISIWLDSCYGVLATQQRDQFLQRKFGAAAADTAAARSIIRPDMIHTLGRWMVRHIAADGQDKKKAIGLLEHPDSIYVWYDRAMASAPEQLRFGW